MVYGRRRRSFRAAPRAIVRTYKKVLNFAPASHGAGVKVNFDLVVGVDNLAVGSTGVTDATVPTGSIVDFIEIQYGVANLAAVACFVHVTMQSRLSGQPATITPNVVGGNPQRNQVHHQEMRSLGQGQNATFVYKWRVPKHLRRIREGSIFSFVIMGTTAITDSCQVIYKLKQ